MRASGDGRGERKEALIHRTPPQQMRQLFVSRSLDSKQRHRRTATPTNSDTDKQRHRQTMPRSSTPVPARVLRPGRACASHTFCGSFRLCDLPRADAAPILNRLFASIRMCSAEMRLLADDTAERAIIIQERLTAVETRGDDAPEVSFPTPTRVVRRRDSPVRPIVIRRSLEGAAIGAANQ